MALHDAGLFSFFEGMVQEIFAVERKCNTEESRLAENRTRGGQ